MLSINIRHEFTLHYVIPYTYIVIIKEGQGQRGMESNLRDRIMLCRHRRVMPCTRSTDKCQPFKVLEVLPAGRITSFPDSVQPPSRQVLFAALVRVFKSPQVIKLF